MGWVNTDDALLPGSLLAIARAWQENPTGGLFGGKLTVVTAKVKDPAAPPATTKLADPPPRPAPDALDQRPLSGLSLLLIGLVLAGLILVGLNRLVAAGRSSKKGE